MIGKFWRALRERRIVRHPDSVPMTASVAEEMGGQPMTLRDWCITRSRLPEKHPGEEVWGFTSYARAGNAVVRDGVVIAIEVRAYGAPDDLPRLPVKGSGVGL